MNNKKISILVILDGWGIGPKDDTNAIHLAKTPTFDFLTKEYPYCELAAHGNAVGLDSHQVSGSETGHMNIGAGRIVEQDSRIISESINNGSFFRNPVLKGAVKHVKKYNSNLHLMGLLGNEDSPHMRPYHLRALLLLTKENGVKNVFIHFFTDGRDSYSKSAPEHLKAWEKITKSVGIGKIATVIGRFYAMDRAKNWDRLKKAYDLLVNNSGKKFSSSQKAIEYFYKMGIGDEYIGPSVITENGKPIAKIEDNDAVVFYNLRSDRARQFSKLFVLDKSGEVKLPKPRLNNLYFAAMTDFGPDLPLHTAFPGKTHTGTLPVAFRAVRQLYIAETEKFAHITYFLNGGFSDSVAGEERIMIPSPITDSYAKIPEMSAEKITFKILNSIKKDKHDFIVVNYANTDMVGHTGDIKATIKAAEAVDGEVNKLYKKIKERDGYLFVTADHGNADCMWDKKAKLPVTFHTKNPVPFIVCNDSLKKKKLDSGGVLGNIAPTICDILEIEKTPEMKLKSLF